MKYLVLVQRQHPFDYDKVLDQSARQAIDQVNDEMVAAGVRVFVGGLKSPDTATTLRPQANGEVLVTDGPYLETKDYIDGLWVLECPNLDAALEWGHKASRACHASIEIRPFA